MSVRRSVRDAGRAVHRSLLGSRHALPDFIVIGAMKSGTTALMDYLMRTESVFTPVNAAGSYVKELHFFDKNHERGPNWYRVYFPLERARPPTPHAIGEGTPYYLFHPLVPERVARLLPSARLIAILRDPVERAWSHYRMSVNLDREPLDFDAALAAEEQRLAADWQRLAAGQQPSDAFQYHSYAARGRYAEQLERWYRHFPREQVLLLTNDALDSEPAGVYEQVLAHLGLPMPAVRPELGVVGTTRAKGPMPDAARASLAQTFEAPNEQLRALTGLQLDAWTQP